MIPTIVVFASGTGTNFEAIVEATKAGVVKAKVTLLVCNRQDAKCLEIAKKNNIPSVIHTIKAGDDRDSYYNTIYNEAFVANDIKPELIVLAGWMLVVPDSFIDRMSKENSTMINLHPALPMQLAGTNAIERAWSQYEQGSRHQSGLMVHHVAPKVDEGEVIDIKVVPIYPEDTYDTFYQRMRYHEKPLLISSINKLLTGHISEETYAKEINALNLSFQPDAQSKMTVKTFATGKVRDCYDVLYNNQSTDTMVIYHSDRISAFNKNFGEVPGKGLVLLEQSAWWMNQTKHIIDNHYLTHDRNCLLVKKCRRVDLEVIVRGYITGSMWKQYEKGERNYCGNILPDGLIKNQKLDEPIVTPTTKDEEDRPITPEEIVSSGLLSRDDWEYLKLKALQLYQFGVNVAIKKGLILVDTKYEFGVDNGKLILIDEIHTSDSSRYWVAESYDVTKEPEKLDKDGARDWVSKNPGKPIPNEVVDTVYRAYSTLYSTLTGKKLIRASFPFEPEFCLNHLTNMAKVYIVVIAGSKSDEAHVTNITTELEKKNLLYNVHYMSAHREPEDVLKLLHGYNARHNQKFIFVTVAGKSNALSGVVSANVDSPVIACPPFKDESDYLVNIHSTLQMPNNVPTMAILSPVNVAESCLRISNFVN